MSISTNTSTSVTINYALAAVVFVGGAFAYAKTGSQASLISSALISAVFGASAYMRNPYISMLGSLLLAGIMSQRYLETKKPMPAFPLIALAVGNGIFQAYALTHVSVQATSGKLF